MPLLVGEEVDQPVGPSGTSRMPESPLREALLLPHLAPGRAAAHEHPVGSAPTKRLPFSAGSDRRYRTPCQARSRHPVVDRLLMPGRPCPADLGAGAVVDPVGDAASRSWRWPDVMSSRRALRAVLVGQRRRSADAAPRPAGCVPRSAFRLPPACQPGVVVGHAAVVVQADHQPAWSSGLRARHLAAVTEREVEPARSNTMRLPKWFPVPLRALRTGPARPGACRRRLPAAAGACVLAARHRREVHPGVF